MVLERIKVKIKNTNREAKPINIFSEKKSAPQSLIRQIIKRQFDQTITVLYRMLCLLRKVNTHLSRVLFRDHKMGSEQFYFPFY